MSQNLDVEKAVRERYAQAAEEKEASLCCPVSYNPRYLELLPKEIIERDYGCGDPSAYVKPGETVLDLGSGGGKICYIAAQIVGASGCVIGVDMNDAMLSLARKYQTPMANQLGYHNVQFFRGKIEDLGLSYDWVGKTLQEHPIQTLEAYQRFEAACAAERQNHPMIAEGSVDVIVSNCVLNLVKPEAKTQLFQEMFRVLKRGGRAVISDIVCDEPPTDAIRNDPELWSGCIAGAYQEQDFLKAFEQAGFYGITLLKREDKPWRTIDGIEFRSVTVQAFKGKQGPCWETNKAVIYQGPWSQVIDDDHHTFVRGVPMTVCEKTFEIMTREPYAGEVLPVLPVIPITPENANPFDCSRDAVRPPKQTKGKDYHKTSEGTDDVCCPPGRCC